MNPWALRILSNSHGVVLSGFDKLYRTQDFDRPTTRETAEFSEKNAGFDSRQMVRIKELA
jgi:hypothetical protein